MPSASSSKSSATNRALGAATPWHSDAAWWIVLIEGIITLAFGLLAVFVPAQAGAWITYFLGIFLLIDGGVWLFSAFRRRGGKAFHLARSGAAILGGLLVVLGPWLSFPPAARAWILGITFLVVGAFSLLAVFLERSRPFSWLRLVIGILLLGVGGLYAYSLITGGSQNVLAVLGWFLTAVGAMLLFYAIYLFSEERKSAQAAAATAAASAPAAARRPAAPAAGSQAPSATQPPAANGEPGAPKKDQAA